MAATVFGMVLVASVMDLKNVVLLSLWGRTVTGTVIGNQPVGRGTTATIRIVPDGKTIEFNEPCFGFDCDRGDSVPVTVLPDDTTVHFASVLKEQVWTVLIATFLIAPLMFGGGTAYSLWRITRVTGSADAPLSVKLLPGLKYVPVLSSLGALLSLVARLIQGLSPLKFEIASTVCLVAGSAVYLVWLRRGYRDGRLSLTLCIILFACGLVLSVVGLI